MRFATKQDIEAPIADVFRDLTDFESWDRAAMRRGAEVDRTDTMTTLAPGISWKAQFSYRSKPRKLTLDLTGVEAPNALAFAARSDALEGQAKIDLLELGARRTRLHVVVDINPRTLAARLFLQSLRLARARIDRKFDQRVAQLAGLIESRYKPKRL